MCPRAMSLDRPVSNNRPKGIVKVILLHLANSDQYISSSYEGVDLMTSQYRTNSTI